MPVDRSDPRDDGAVVEADDELHLHRDLAANSLDDTNHVRLAAARRHEVDHAGYPASCFEIRFEYQGVSAIAASGGRLGCSRADEPATVAFVAEQGGKARAGIEPRQTEPVNRAVSANKAGGMCVADETVVLDF